jgi:tRNA(Ile)-lysidine synthase
MTARANATTPQIGIVPPGPWAVGVSGGADSVCLLALLHDRPDLSLHVVHLNHETRAAQSNADAAFVAELAARWGLPCTVVRLSDVTLANPPANVAARYRAARLKLFTDVITHHRLRGVILGHHADDQAETVLQRLLRGSGVAGLGGIAAESKVDGLTILHPLLHVPAATLRDELRRRDIPWREDASNQTTRFLRNRLRQVLADRPKLTETLVDLGSACDALRQWLDRTAPELPEAFATAQIAGLCRPLAEHAMRRWLRERGSPAEDINGETIERLRAMAEDAASPARQSFPGNVSVRRRRGRVFIDEQTRA